MADPTFFHRRLSLTMQSAEKRSSPFLHLMKKSIQINDALFAAAMAPTNAGSSNSSGLIPFPVLPSPSSLTQRRRRRRNPKKLHRQRRVGSDPPAASDQRVQERRGMSLEEAMLQLKTTMEEMRSERKMADRTGASKLEPTEASDSKDAYAAAGSILWSLPISQLRAHGDEADKQQKENVLAWTPLQASHDPNLLSGYAFDLVLSLYQPSTVASCSTSLSIAAPSSPTPAFSSSLHSRPCAPRSPVSPTASSFTASTSSPISARSGFRTTTLSPTTHYNSRPQLCFPLYEDPLTRPNAVVLPSLPSTSPASPPNMSHVYYNTRNSLPASFPLMAPVSALRYCNRCSYHPPSSPSTSSSSPQPPTSLAREIMQRMFMTAAELTKKRGHRKKKADGEAQTEKEKDKVEVLAGSEMTRGEGLESRRLLALDLPLSSVPTLLRCFLPSSSSASSIDPHVSLHFFPSLPSSSFHFALFLLSSPASALVFHSLFYFLLSVFPVSAEHLHRILSAAPVVLFDGLAQRQAVELCMVLRSVGGEVVMLEERPSERTDDAPATEADREERVDVYVVKDGVDGDGSASRQNPMFTTTAVEMTSDQLKTHAQESEYLSDSLTKISAWLNSAPSFPFIRQGALRYSVDSNAVQRTRAHSPLIAISRDGRNY